jgi:hypothetical protein
MTVLHRLACFGALNDRSTFTLTDARAMDFGYCVLFLAGLLSSVSVCVCVCLQVLKLSTPPYLFNIVFWCKHIVSGSEVYDLINSIDVSTDLKERFSEVLIV